MFEIFKIGFLPVTLLDVIDVVIVGFIIYKLYTTLRGTVAAQIFSGLVIVLLLSFAAQAIDLRALNWLLKFITDIWIIAFIILFQPEIRRLLVIVSRNPFFKMRFRSDSSQYINVIADASFELAQHQHGALIVLIKSSGIRGIAESGDVIGAKLSKDLLRSIFYPRSPLHDGAVIIKHDTIEAARCTLPLSSQTMMNGETLGMRHRAGLGVSEIADVICIIVSEETGSISVAEAGGLSTGLSKDALKKRLVKIYRQAKFKKLTLSGQE